MVSYRQLVALGFGPGAIKTRAANGRLHRLFRGVYAVGHVPRTQEARWIAAVIAAGPGAVLSHLDAARLWGIYDGRGPRIHVTTTTRSPRSLGGIVAHRSRRLDADDVTTKDGIPVTTVARTLVDLGDMLPDDRVRRAIREAAYLRLVDPTALEAALERGRGRRNLRALREAVARGIDRGVVRSELEHRFLELVRHAGLPAPETNVRVETKRRVHEVDCLWRAQHVVVELDGRAAHALADAFEHDRERDASLSAIGLRPLRYTWRRVTNDGDEVVAELRELLGASGYPSAPSSRSTRRSMASDDA